MHDTRMNNLLIFASL